MTKYSVLARWVLLGCGFAVVFYCLFILAFVATSPDIGLRCLLVDDPPDAPTAGQPGPQIQIVTLGLNADGEAPEVGDRLISIGGLPTTTFMHFARSLVALRNPEIRPGGELSDRADLRSRDLLPPLVKVDGVRWVKVEFLRDGDPELHKTWLQVHSLPGGEVSLSFLWFILEFGLFMVGTLAFVTRPGDRSAKLFFAMCIVTVGAFVGGYHWWLIAASLWLIIPFMICAMLVPVVTLHFFLIYPHERSPLVRRPRASLVALYGIPVLSIGLLVALTMYSSWIYYSDLPPDQQALRIQHVLSVQRDSIYAYLAIAAAYFLMTLGALARSYRENRAPLVQSQLKWFLWAGFIATFPVGYTLYLARWDPVGFALGHASLPMFAASLSFMLAYAVGFLRYRLMLVDQMLTRGMSYYAVSFMLTVVYSLAIASSSLVGMYQIMQAAQQAAAVMVTMMIAVVLFGWFRDRLQQLIDRRFFREKYQLDKVMQRMNQAVVSLVDTDLLGGRMLTSCRDVLSVEHAALYLSNERTSSFQLIATEGEGHCPLQFPANLELIGQLRTDRTVQRLSAELPEEASQTQMILRELDADVVHALEIDGDLGGVVLLGPKRGGAPYTAEDLTFLTALAQMTSVALHSARVHQSELRLNEELRLKIDKIAEQQRMISVLQAELTGKQEPVEPSEEEPFRRGLIRGNSESIRQVLTTVRKVSGSQSSVLIRGESGTGKELLAQALHDNSPRRGGQMVSVHCGALSAGLLESELFGHVKGSFTGAHRDKVGRFELAHGGTLFLDEIGDISLETQIKLLRVLQERSFEPVGGTKSIEVDVRLIAATHQDLERLISQGKFREDLFYRLNVISITLPPLRERADDVFELALHFLSRASQQVGKSITQIDDAAVDALKRYPWPGNIRELENALERAVVLAEHSTITIHDLPPQIVRHAPQVVETKPFRVSRSPATVPESVAEEPQTTNNQERAQLVRALERTNGNKAEAARLLGMPRSTYFSKLKKYRIE